MKYLISDHLPFQGASRGSIVAITDNTGNVLAETRYLPFGEPCADAGSLAGTDKTYTGQHDVPDMGLMDYRARMYSPWLGRFIQPDTIVPGAGNSQAWNRFSYTLNNPVNYTDPSGHKACIDWDDNGQCVEDPDWHGKNNPLPEDPYKKGKNAKYGTDSSPYYTSDFILDNFIWTTIPSAIGFQLGGHGQIGYLLEIGMAKELEIVFNWRSGELSIMSVEGPHGWLGTPNIFEIDVYGGKVKYFGVSENSNLEGLAVYGGWSGSGDILHKIGGEEYYGIAIDNGKSFPPTPYIDPGSSMYVTYTQNNIYYGFNQHPNVVDVGMIGGAAGTRILFNFDLY